MKTTKLLTGALAMIPFLCFAAQEPSDFTVVIPEDASITIAVKTKHYVDFTEVAPVAESVVNGEKTVTFSLDGGQVYNYRTWKEGGLTHAGYFTMNADKAKQPDLHFTEADFQKHDPKAVNHDVNSNLGYETGDIFVNINPQGHLKLNVGDTFKAHAMRTWELTDNSVNNYFIEPDFHYTVLNPDGSPSEGVVEIRQKAGSPWAEIVAKSQGTVLVLVTYDGINLNYYSGADKKDYLGGEYWGAIWPENTAVYVVSVGENPSEVVPNMLVNEDYNKDTLKNAGKFVDAEHDVFYYLDSEPGFPFTFTPENVSEVEIAYPVFTDSGVEYNGFTSDGVSKGDDGSFTILLKEGRQVVRLADVTGNAVYQVLTARKCHREIIHSQRPGSRIFQPGEKVSVQYSGLFHPANKLAGIYNMSAYVTYNDVPNGTSLIEGSGQYTFGSAPAAQAVTVSIPADLDPAVQPEIVLSRGVIQVNGFGDPIGNHRIIDPEVGRSPNFNAVAHKTYFGAIPDVVIPVSATRNFVIYVEGVPENAVMSMSFLGKPVTPGDNGSFTGTYGIYSVEVQAEGYRCYRHDFSIDDDADEEVVFTVELEKSESAWDGKSSSAPAVNETGQYVVTNGSELAYIAQKVNAGELKNMAVILDDDIDLGDYSWTPIGISSAKAFIGTFDGQGHVITGLYDPASANYQGLFGYVKAQDTDHRAKISNLAVYGKVQGKQYTAGIVGYTDKYVDIDQCANYVDVTGTSNVGGVVGKTSADSNITNSYNAGRITGTSNVGGVAGSHVAATVFDRLFNVGTLTGTSNVGACVGSSLAKTKVTNTYALKKYTVDDNSEIVTDERMAGGEVAFRLGKPFSQTIGVHPHPVFDGLDVFQDPDTEEFYNNATGFAIDLGEGNGNVKVEDGTVEMSEGDSYQLSLVSIPTGARLPSVEWSSSNEDVVTVNNEGTLTAVAKGKAVVTAKVMIADNEVTQECHITVLDAWETEVGTILNSSTEKVDIYDINGRIVKLDADPFYCRHLAPGLYILRTPSSTTKLLIP